MADDSNPVRSRTDDPAPERLFAEVVLNWRRRYVLYYLSEHPDPVPTGELAAQVAAWERAERAAESDAPHRWHVPDGRTIGNVESVSASLRERDLPRLDELDLVTYDRGSDRVTGRSLDPTVEIYVRNDPRTSVPWHRVYLVLTAVATVLLGLVRIRLPPFDGVEPITVAGLVVFLFGVVSFAYWYDARRGRRRTGDEPPDFLVSLDEEIPFEEGEEDETDGENGPKSEERFGDEGG